MQAFLEYLGFAQLSRILTTLLMFRWGYVNTEKVLHCLIMIILLQLDKIMKEKEALFLEEKSSLWKELTDGFKKARFEFVQSFSFRSSKWETTRKLVKQCV